MILNIDYSFQYCDNFEYSLYETLFQYYIEFNDCLRNL